jgi:protein-S-isoprenylcysteine O-methyltransferase Ste14
MVLGLFMLAAAIAIELATALTFRRHKTTILPHRAATRLITSGPFAWSRNPIYLANTMLLIGVGLAFGIGWLVLTAPFAAGLTLLLAIKREERHLAQQFGDDWKAYAARTGRWFGKH